ncbi:MAG: DUF937 domain-containing protein [Oscillospiraceae bacterium]
MALNDTLTKELLGKKSVASISKSTGIDSKQVGQIVTAALPILISGMCQNSESKEGSQALATALEAHAQQKTDDAAKMLSEADSEDGKKIVSHILGEHTENIASGLSAKTGLSSEQVMSVVGTLAPVIMSMIGNHSSTGEGNKVDSGGLGGILTSLLLGSGGNGTSTKSAGIDVASIATALLGSVTSSGDNKSESNTGSVAGSLLGSLLGGGGDGGNGNGNELASVAGSLIGSLLGGTGEGKKGKKDESAVDAIGSLLGSFLK